MTTPRNPVYWKATFQRWAERLESSPAAIVGVITALYVLMLVPLATRPLWHDELYTFYIANEPSFDRFIEEIRRFDLNPPLLYGVTRVANRLLGLSPLATRMPSFLAYYGSSVFLFIYLRRKIGHLYSAITVLLFWSGVFFYYAAEARPYALLLFFCGLNLVCYEAAISRERRSLALIGVAAGCAGMVLSHAFAPFSMAPFFLAEAVRYGRTRKPDWALWAALIVPLGCIVLYIPLISHFQRTAFASLFQPTLSTPVHFYWILARRSVFGYIAVLAGGIAGLAFGHSVRHDSRWKATDVALAAGFAFVPLVIMAMLMRTHGAFWDRYCITSAAAVYVVVGGLIAGRFRGKLDAAFGAFVLLVAVLLVSKVAKPLNDLRFQLPNAGSLASIQPELPLVSASGITFLEMDHNEARAITDRLYYLSDRQAAMQYSRSTLFEGFALLKTYFPIHSHVETFATFVREHPRFLVLSRPEFPENWLLPKLRHDGASIRQIGNFNLPYPDKDLYEVSVNDKEP